METLFWLQLGGCVFMAGLIWTIQLVHYPAFAWIDRARFAEFETFHSRRISWIVMPVMIIELLSAAGVAALGVRINGHELGRDPRSLAALAILLVFCWGVTGFVSVPSHRRLEEGFDEKAWRRLVGTNWLRTLGWTARAALLITAVTA